MVTLGHSNVTDNLDLQLKYKAAQIRNDIFPSIITFNLGVAWNTEVGDRSKGDSRNFQYFVKLIYNTLIINKIGIGLVPSYLHNSALTTEEIKYSFTMGTHLSIIFPVPGVYFLNGIPLLQAGGTITTQFQWELNWRPADIFFNIYDQ